MSFVFLLTGYVFQSPLIDLLRVASAHNTGDLFTKVLPASGLTRLRNLLRLVR